ncbi:CPSaseIIsmall: carbamoyl-phosphate synthase, small subunit [Rubrobacter radiotolerans]|uniref:Carbamoyl phosphate synthase small chain n=1 Tax=Rubrobacter radiotolerans TaxID=42256 RepID=A0A023X352_RUBRA|nr:glutamine-hydrolyzing carbamoyl-phosphate synthase small subunit [Rubrobacter radiotolerans]AHY46768.1 CPSaseIIsmall: carbamoyl-phosphate synthase, small subunit [Rubrobacter radiotolerans]MDX5894175.1 glutamine-hydrolyzing carbamoyl-phosphate synthase small subunit [Rubrobacter radiotolerans]SMC05398.1 carbamoyl-phosphate synthase small subunit [Rubrobacter radiotolerans DSM 5868]
MEYGRSRAVLVLEDGAAFEGWSFAGDGEVAGEVVFTTSMVGYQETITDPSYRGQIVLFTYPLIGNYGVIAGDEESRKVQAAAVIVREYTPHHSNWASERSLAALLNEAGVMGIEGIDTRALTRHLRDKGAMRGIISTVSDDRAELKKRANEHPEMVGLDLASTSSQFTEPTLLEAIGEERCRITALDYGVKASIYRELRKRGATVLAMPGTTTTEEILATEPDGVFLSNGPGDPAALERAVEVIKPVIGEVPVFGICLGHQLLGLALECETYKMPFGHHGANHPVRNLKTGRIEITSQNHGFSIYEDSLPDGVELTHRNLYDGTVEGLEDAERRASSVQYHPESSPGPRDSGYLFDDFLESISRSASHGKAGA